jgi:hypothetical protein
MKLRKVHVRKKQRAQKAEIDRKAKSALIVPKKKK